MIKFAIVLVIICCASISRSQSGWTQKTTLAAAGRDECATFVIGTKAYLVTGYGTTCGYLKELWEYDSNADSWTRKSDFPGPARFAANGFAIGNKGYVCGGSSTGVTIGYNDLWEYDPQLDQWTSKAPFPGALRDAAISFSVGSKGYFGTGRAISPSAALNDFWCYDAATNHWTQLANVPGSGRTFAISFVVNGRGYVGYGYPNSYPQLNDLYVYDTLTNTWSAKSPAGFSTAQSGCFVIGGKVYIGTGYISYNSCDSALWRYDPMLNTISKVSWFAGGQRCCTTGLTINGRGYMGFGVYGNWVLQNDLYEYIPDISHEDELLRPDLLLSPNPTHDRLFVSFDKSMDKISIHITDVLGKLIHAETYTDKKEIVVDLSADLKGVYFVHLLSDGRKLSRRIVLE